MAKAEKAELPRSRLRLKVNEFITGRPLILSQPAADRTAAVAALVRHPFRAATRLHYQHVL
jgi:hypothetical protein